MRLRDLEGRTHRLGFLGYLIFGNLVAAVAYLLLDWLTGPTLHGIELGDVAWVFAAALGYFVIVPASIRRLHDIGWSGWRVVIPLVFAATIRLLSGID